MRLEISPLVEVKAGQVYTAPRWKGDRRVDALTRVRVDGAWTTRVDYLDLRTSRTGWVYLDVFIKDASLKEPA